MKKKNSDAIEAQLRAEPDYIDLCKLLDEQSPARKARLSYELTSSQRCEPSQNQGVDEMEPKTRALDTRILSLKDTEGLSFTEIAARLNLEGFTNQAGGKFTKKNVSGRYYRLKAKLSSQAAQGCEYAPTEEHAAIVARRGETEQPDHDLANVANVCEESPGITLEDLPCEPSQVCDDEAGEPREQGSCEPCETCENPQAVTYVANDAKPREPCDDAQPVSGVSDPAKHGDDPQNELPSHMVATLRKLIREELQALSEHDPNLAKAAKPDVDLPPPTPKITGSKKFMGTRVNLPGCRVDKALADGFEAQRSNLAISASELMQRILWLYLDKPRLSFEG